MSEIELFRAEVRAFLEASAPSSLRGLAFQPEGVYWGGRRRDTGHSDSARFCELMAERGWTAPTWPKAYGGGGLDKVAAGVLNQELGRLQLPAPLYGFGLQMIGPILLQFGSEQQKQEHIPGIVRGEIRWCQGYSEPGAGSDLASLQTSAVVDGDELVINGQKIWTSFGDRSDWMFALVRTGRGRVKQQGISFVLLDMAQSGVEVRPIRLLSGGSPFCETFFTDARARLRNVVNGCDNGWVVAKALLAYERVMIGGSFGDTVAPRAHGQGLRALADAYLGAAKRDGSESRERMIQHVMDQCTFNHAIRRHADALRAGEQPGAESSILKIYGTELNQRNAEVMLTIRGPQSLGWDGAGFTSEELAQTRAWLRSRGNTIEGGTSEVQLNTIAKRVLVLPD